MAAGLYELETGQPADSAGTLLSSDSKTIKERTKTNPGAQNVIDVMKEVGIDVADNKITQLSEDMIDKYDQIIVMAEQDSTPPYLADSPKVEYWDVPDAAGMDLQFHRQTRDAIHQKITALLNNSAQPSPNQTRGH